jgi:hypothetical protein
MTLSRTCLCCLGLLAAAAVSPATAQALSWHVVAGESATVVTPDLPSAASRTLQDVAIGDAGGTLQGFRVQGAASAEGYWALSAGRLQRYAQLGSTGVPGPGRGGAEAAHTFLSLPGGSVSTGPDGQRSFAARAGDPAATLTATHGLWRWTGGSNIEFARASTDGVLGPGLGAGWVFPNLAGFAEARMLGAGRAVFVAEVTSPTSASHRIIARHAPGEANLPCMRTSATEPALAPGLVPGDSFSNTALTLGRVGASRTGRIYARLPASGSREGIFVLCEGAPRAIAADNVAGLLGPDTGTGVATFTGFSSMAPQPAGEDDVVFFANWREPSSTTRVGLFRHDGVANRGLAYSEPSGFHGPNWLDATWRSFNVDSLSVAGDTVAFVAGLDTADGGDPTGLFRVRTGQSPELVALLGLIGAPYEPEPGRTWRSFDALAVFESGDIVLDATTNPNATRDLWLLRPGRAPRRLLSPGQPLRVPTAQGFVDTTISSYNVPLGGARHADGSDGWIGADGTMLFAAQAVGFNKVLVTTRAPVLPPGIVHRDGFEP